MELVWSAFSQIRTEYGWILRIFPYSVRMWENAEQNNSHNGHVLRSPIKSLILVKLLIVGVRDLKNLYKAVSHKEYVLLPM